MAVARTTPLPSKVSLTDRTLTPVMFGVAC